MVLRLRLSPHLQPAPFADFAATLQQRQQEADAFYADLQADQGDAEARMIQRQALAGMIWTRQYYRYDLRQWLEGDPAQPPPPPQREAGRNHLWRHINCNHVLSMPDKWEFPWFAAWDLGFHSVAFAAIDAEFAKDQVLQLVKTWYQHPNGQLPAYEWNFSDVNPPVHAWAAWRVFEIDRSRNGHGGDFAFLKRAFHKLLLNFSWWVNRKDAQNRNIFEGGFLGLDNIGVFDRSKPLPNGMFLEQADATSWMAMYCLNLMRIALELSTQDPAYQDLATQFFEHFLHIAQAMTAMGKTGRIGLWDEEDEFYYDAISVPDGGQRPMKVRSMVGLIPLFAVEILEPELMSRVPDFQRHLLWYFQHRPDMVELVSYWEIPGMGRRRLLSLLRGHRMKALLRRMLDATEFLSDFGVRSMSRYHLEHPYILNYQDRELRADYEPGESTTDMFGGNSNWRGPVWIPVNYLIIESLQRFHHYYGDDFLVECPTGSGRMQTLRQIAAELMLRLSRLFRRDAVGRRPVFGSYDKLQTDPHFRDYLLFHEYFHGDTGRGCGASHQTGWTGLIASLLQSPGEQR
jgi:hypothetical protein